MVVISTNCADFGKAVPSFQENAFSGDSVFDGRRVESSSRAFLTIVGGLAPFASSGASAGYHVQVLQCSLVFCGVSSS